MFDRQQLVERSVFKPASPPSSNREASLHGHEWLKGPAEGKGVVWRDVQETLTRFFVIDTLSNFP